MTFTMCVLDVLFYVLTMLMCVRGMNNEKSVAGQLYEDVFETKNYNPSIRPVIDDNETLEISVYFEILSLHYLDEKTETFKATAYVQFKWTDYQLSWNRRAQDVEAMTYPQSDIWTPDVVLTNSYHQSQSLGDKDMKVIVLPVGIVTMESIEVFTSSCELDTTFFPFDRQTCIVNFVVWSYFRESVNLVSSVENQNTGLHKYESHPGWELQETSISLGKLKKSSIKYSIILKRKASYYIQNFLLPTLMLTTLSIMVFLLPHDSGERASYSITVFLSMVVMLTILNSILPVSSSTTCLFALYLIIEIGLSTLMTIVNIILLRMVTFSDENEVPTCLRRIVHRCGRQTTISPTTEEHQEKIEKTKDEQLTLNWVDVVRALDKLCFFCFLLVSSLVTVVMLCVCATNDGQ